MRQVRRVYNQLRTINQDMRAFFGDQADVIRGIRDSVAAEAERSQRHTMYVWDAVREAQRMIRAHDPREPAQRPHTPEPDDPAEREQRRLRGPQTRAEEEAEHDRGRRYDELSQEAEDEMESLRSRLNAMAAARAGLPIAPSVRQELARRTTRALRLARRTPLVQLPARPQKTPV